MYVTDTAVTSSSPANSERSVTVSNITVDSARYTVADILSSMANANGTNADGNTVTHSVNGTTVGLTYVPLTTSGIVASAPAINTSAGQTYIELQAPHSFQRREVYRRSQEAENMLTSWTKSLVNRAGRQDPTSVPVVTSTTRRTGGRRAKQEALSAEEEQRRVMRRERNKLAAAKCRKRRMDHTNELVQETERLEDKRREIEDQIEDLKTTKEELQYLLEAHAPLCKNRDLLGKMGQCNDLTFTRKSAHSPPLRPSTLDVPGIARKQKTIVEVAGIPITTPSGVSVTPMGGGFFPDNLISDSTGLTPIIATTCASAVLTDKMLTGERRSSERSKSPTLVSL